MFEVFLHKKILEAAPVRESGILTEQQAKEQLAALRNFVWNLPIIHVLSLWEHALAFKPTDIVDTLQKRDPSFEPDGVAASLKINIYRFLNVF